MYFKCEIGGITVEKLAIISAVQTLFHEQSMACTVTSLEPVTFEVKPQLSQQMRDRLIVNRVGVVLQGYEGTLEGNSLVISSKETDSTPKRGRTRAS